MKKDQWQELPLNQRFTLTLKEASQYFHINGEWKILHSLIALHWEHYFKI
jgi:hypothetical protein